MKKDIKAVPLIFPLWIEYISRTLISYVSIFILNSYSDRAAAAVSVCSQIIYLLTIFYNMISLGIVTILSQKLGNEKCKNNDSTVSAAIILNLFFGIIISIIVSTNAELLMKLMGLEGELLFYGTKYLSIVGVFSFVTSVSVTVSAVLRSYQLTKYTMYIMLLTNLLNIIGGYVSVFRPFGIPQLGIAGVAYSAALSQLCGTFILLFIMLRKLKIKIKIDFNSLMCEAKEIYRIGIPSALEVLAGHLSSLVIIKIITSMGDEQLVTRTYVYNIMLFIMSFSNSIGQGTQIMVGYYVGNNQNEKAYKVCWKNLKVAMVISFIFATIVYIFRNPVLVLYTQDSEILRMATPLMFLVIFLEVGRCLNLVIVSALKGAGDVKFPVFLGIATMWGLGVLGSYVLGIRLEIGLTAIWISYCLDEWIRGSIIALRWKSHKWETKQIVVD